MIQNETHVIIERVVIVDIQRCSCIGCRERTSAQNTFAPFDGVAGSCHCLVCRFGTGQGAVVADKLFLLIGQRVVCLARCIDIPLARVGIYDIADIVDQRDHLIRYVLVGWFGSR